MAASRDIRPPDSRRVVPVRLCDVPLDTRVRAARRVCRDEPDPSAKWEVFLAARFPSGRVYWVAR